jgi:fumarylacetoacetase
VSGGYGVFIHNGQTRVGYRRGDLVYDLAAASRAGLVDGPFDGDSLTPFLAAGPRVWHSVARQVEGLSGGIPVAEVRTRMPFTVGDYVDFYSSEHHAANVGAILRPGEPAVPPNWRHLPIGYHGRAGTVVVSGTPIRRPYGLRGPGDAGPTRRLDIEAEVGFVVGVPSRLGYPLSTVDFRDHVFGVVLVNDWSARDLQAFEYRPLGPFLGKSFATSVSPWVVPLSSLTRTDAPPQDPPVVDYLTEADRYTFDIELSVEWNGEVVSRPPFRSLYWTPAQQLAHLTVNGASVRTGDLYASGTVSGPDEVGSLLELHKGGRFLADGDTVTIRGRSGATDLGAVVGTVVG